MKLRWEKPEGDDWKTYETTQLAMMAFGKKTRHHLRSPGWAGAPSSPLFDMWR
jgi:hypothetical protein